MGSKPGTPGAPKTRRPPPHGDPSCSAPARRRRAPHPVRPRPPTGHGKPRGACLQARTWLMRFLLPGAPFPTSLPDENWPPFQAWVLGCPVTASQGPHGPQPVGLRKPWSCCPSPSWDTGRCQWEQGGWGLRRSQRPVSTQVNFPFTSIPGSAHVGWYWSLSSDRPIPRRPPISPPGQLWRPWSGRPQIPENLAPSPADLDLQWRSCPVPVKTGAPTMTHQWAFRCARQALQLSRTYSKCGWGPPSLSPAPLPTRQPQDAARPAVSQEAAAEAEADQATEPR